MSSNVNFQGLATGLDTSSLIEATLAQESAPLIPMKRPGTAHEIAEAILWLASDASSYSTGTIIDCTGGR